MSCGVSLVIYNEVSEYHAINEIKSINPDYRPRRSGRQPGTATRDRDALIKLGKSFQVENQLYAKHRSLKKLKDFAIWYIIVLYRISGRSDFPGKIYDNSFYNSLLLCEQSPVEDKDITYSKKEIPEILADDYLSNKLSDYYIRKKADLIECLGLSHQYPSNHFDEKLWNNLTNDPEKLIALLEDIASMRTYFNDSADVLFENQWRHTIPNGKILLIDEKAVLKEIDKNILMIDTVCKIVTVEKEKKRG